jgi:2'-5' RNA ligase
MPNSDAPENPGAGRLFLAIPLTENARSAMRLHLQNEELPGRLVPPDKWHLTVRFLGDTSQDALALLRATLGAEPLGHATDIVFGGLGAFPRVPRASVLWIGVTDGVDALRAIAENVEAAVRRAGIPAEPRPFSPHLTLSRLQPPRNVAAIVERVPALDVRMTVDAVVLMRSHPQRGPSLYEAVQRFELAVR